MNVLQRVNQRRFVDGMLEGEWPTEALGDVETVGELSPFVKCWGSSGEDDDLHELAGSVQAQDVRLLDAGVLHLLSGRPFPRRTCTNVVQQKKPGPAAGRTGLYHPGPVVHSAEP